jgi:PAS domain S-box-containing protein
VVDDYQTWSGRAAVYADYPFNTVVGVPIQWGQEHLGVLNVANRPTPFSDDDVELLTLLAAQAAIALRNAQLVNSLQESEQRYRTLLAQEQRQAQELALLDRVRTALAGELDLPTLLRTVVEAIAETFGYTLVSLYLLEGDTLVLQHQVGYEHVIPYIPISQGVSGRVVRTRQPVLLEDVRTAPEFLGAIEGIVSEICIPLFDESQVVGCFNIESTQGMTLNQADLELMLALGQHINVALSRARLYTAARESEERFRQLAENIEDVFWMTNLDSSETIYVSPAYESLWGCSIQNIYDQPRSWLDIVHPQDRAQIEMLFERQDRTKYNVKEYRIVRPDGLVRWVLDRSFPVPNEAGQVYRVAGIIEDITERKQNEEALQRHTAELATLLEVSRAISSPLDFDTVVMQIAEHMGRVIDATSVYICSIEPQTLTSSIWAEYISPSACVEERVSDKGIIYDLQRDYPKTLKLLQAGQNWVAHVADVNLLDAVKHAHMRQFGAKSILMVPLQLGNQVLAYAELWESRQQREFTPREVALVEGIAQQAAVALQNARLYQQAQREIVERRQAETVLARQARELEALYETSLEINAQTDLSTLLQAIVERAAGLVGVTMGGLYLLQPDNQTLELVISHQLPGDFVGVRLRLGEGLSGRVAQTGQPIMIEDYSHWTGRAVVFADIPLQRVLGIPLKVKDRIIGVINVSDVERTSAFSQEEIRLVSMFADQAAIAIENARLYQQTRQDAEIKETLLQEANHRVKNNLSTIIGLLYAEYRHTQDENQPIFQDIMQNLIGRVQGLATVHSLLSATQWTQISLSQLTRQVIETALRGLPPKQRVQVEVSPSPVQITPQQANNLALVINELTTNTVKYTLTDSQPGRITVFIATTKDTVCLEFHSSGPGYPPEVRNRQWRNVGLYLVENIVQKGLHGSVTFSNNFGAVTTIIFPASID